MAPWKVRAYLAPFLSEDQMLIACTEAMPPDVLLFSQYFRTTCCCSFSFLAASTSTQTSMDAVVSSLAVLTAKALVPGNDPVEYIASNVGQFKGP